MARVRLLEIVDHFALVLRAALDEAVDRALPGVEVDKRKLYMEFRRALSTRTKAWETAPNSAVDAD